MAPRVDFKHVREHGSFEAVLNAYNIELKKDGARPRQFKALCPFHQDTKPSLKVNTERNIYHCFVCGAKGNILEFVRDRDKLGQDGLRTAALKVAALSGIAPTPNGTEKARSASAPPTPPPTAETPVSAQTEAPEPNRVLSFELRTTRDQPLLAWLAIRGISESAQATFALGRASAKSKTIGDRLAIPIHNAEGELVAYCGRYVGDTVPDDVAKYKLPPNFRKDLEVFNLHRAVHQVDRFRAFLVFESYFSVIRHHEHAASVSCMGRSISPQQLTLLIEHMQAAGAQKAIVVADGDQPGRDGARAIAGALAPLFWTRVLDLDDGVKPHHLDWEELRTTLRAAW